MLKLFIPAIVLGLLFTACSTEVDLEGPWRDIPVVYGFLSLQDTAHYIRVEKAFLPDGGDARQAAQIPDSLYYDDLSVRLEKLNTGQVYDLRRVDGNAEGYPRQEGPFATAPNYLYKIDASEIKLDGGEPVRLILIRGEGAPLATAETQVLEELMPRPTSPASPVNMAYDRQVNFAWQAGPNARLFDVRLRIRYRESEPGDPDVLHDRSLIWVLDDAFEREGEEERITYSIQGEEFYRFLGESLEADAAVIRVFDGFDLLLAAAGPELAELLRIAEANVGLTGFESVPVYTNLDGGLGIFSSRAFATRPDLTLDGPSRDSLIDGIHTAELNFR